jgi:hypothetical protein
MKMMTVTSWRHQRGVTWVPPVSGCNPSTVGGGVWWVCEAVVGPEREMGLFAWLSAHAGFKGFPIF